jgi:hypothetical protein
MPSMIDQIRASKLPSNMMQFAARGALQVSPAENIEILVYLALHNKVFRDTARMTLAGWDEKSSLTAAADPKTPAEVLNYMIAPDNLRPALLPALLENPSVPEALIAKLAVSAGRDAIDTLLKSARVRSLATVLQTLKANPYLKKEEVEELKKTAPDKPATAPIALPVAAAAAPAKLETQAATPEAVEKSVDPTEGGDDEAVAAYFNEHASEIAAEGNKPFQAIGGLAELLLSESTEQIAEAPAPEPAAATPAAPARPAAKSNAPPEGKRENTVQKVNRLDVKGRIQLALKGNKEERSLLIRDGTKVVALSVLEAPKLSDGEVEKFASQKNVLEAVLRQIPLKRRFMKNYIVVRNLVANPRTPLDLGLGLMKNLLPGDLKNISANKDVSETIRKLALKMYKQKMEAANKK